MGCKQPSLTATQQIQSYLPEACPGSKAGGRAYSRDVFRLALDGLGYLAEACSGADEMGSTWQECVLVRMGLS